MNCIQDEKLLEQYIDGELASNDFSRVEKSVENCDHCRAYVDDANVLRSAVQKSISDAVDAAPLHTLWERIEKELDLSEATTPAPVSENSMGLLERLQTWLRSDFGMAALATCAALIVGVVVYQQTDSPVQKDNTQRAIAMSDVTVKNTLVIESLDVSEGTVVIDADPSEEMPTIVWHFVDDEQEGS